MFKKYLMPAICAVNILIIPATISQASECVSVSSYMKQAGVSKSDYIMTGSAEGMNYLYFKNKKGSSSPYMYIFSDMNNKCAFGMSDVSKQEFLNDKKAIENGNYDGEGSEDYEG